VGAGHYAFAILRLLPFKAVVSVILIYLEGMQHFRKLQLKPMADNFQTHTFLDCLFNFFASGQLYHEWGMCVGGGGKLTIIIRDQHWTLPKINSGIELKAMSLLC
jgi:hypothetical protein